jgi:phytoene dehydrogenase-like protein
MKKLKVVVVGAGISGLMAAAILVKNKYDVTVVDKASTVGGNAGWYVRKNHMFPTGATIAFGLEKDGLLYELLKELNVIDRLELSLLNHPMDVVLPDRKLSVYYDEQKWYDELSIIFSERSNQVIAFWKKLSEIAQTVEAVTKTKVALPIRKWIDLGDLPKYLLTHPLKSLFLLRYTLKTVEDLLKQYQLTDFAPFRYFLNAQLVDAAQTDVHSAALLPSAVALDIYRRGSFAVKGGLGEISRVLAQLIVECGGQIVLNNEVHRIRKQETGANWFIDSKKINGEFDIVVNSSGNTLIELPSLKKGEKEQWGAFRIDAIVDRSALQDLFDGQQCNLPFAWQIVPEPIHRQLFGDEHGPIYVTFHDALDGKGNVILDEVMMTASVHTDIKLWQNLSKQDYLNRKEQYSNVIFTEFKKVFPQIERYLKSYESGTPLTYLKFIGKVEVGGLPLNVKHAILQPTSVYTNDKTLFLAGDQVFPGPGTFSSALSGYYVSRAIMNRFPLK